MGKWVKLLLGIVASGAAFVGVLAFVNDVHPLGGGAAAYERQSACVEQGELAGVPTDYCYDAYWSELAGIEANEMWIAAASGAAAVGLFWLLAYLLYFRPKRRRAVA